MKVWCLTVDAGVCDGPDQQRDAVLLRERSSRIDLSLVSDQERRSGRPHASCRGQDKTLDYSISCVDLNFIIVSTGILTYLPLFIFHFVHFYRMNTKRIIFT